MNKTYSCKKWNVLLQKLSYIFFDTLHQFYEKKLSDLLWELNEELVGVTNNFTEENKKTVSHNEDGQIIGNRIRIIFR